MDKTLDRAWILMQSNRFDRAEQEIRKHLSENPDDASAHTMLAMCLFDLSRHDDAIESGKKAIELVPENPYPYWVLGCLYIRLQQLDLAEKYLFEAIELNPECPDYYASLSELYWMRGCSRNLSNEQKKEFLEKGIKAARTSLEIDSEHLNAMLFLIKSSLTLRKHNYFPEAIELVKKLLSLAPESAIAHEVYARVLTHKHGGRKNKQDLNEILSILKESLRLDPTRSEPKMLGQYLLENYYEFLPSLSNISSWFYESIVFTSIFAFPMLVLTFWSYYIHNWQLYPTIACLITTLLSLIFITEQSYIRIKIWLNIEHRKFLSPNPIFKIFWCVFSVVLFFGFTWNLLPLSVTRIISIFLLILSIPTTLYILYMTGKAFLYIRRSTSKNKKIILYSKNN